MPEQSEQNEQAGPNVFVIRDAWGATRETCTHVRGFYGDGGENEGVLSVHAVVKESANYPDIASSWGPRSSRRSWMGTIPIWAGSAVPWKRCAGSSRLHRRPAMMPRPR